MSKTVEDLRKSRDRRTEILRQFGGELPQSIMKHNKAIKAIDLMAERRSYASKANAGGHRGKLAEVFDVSGQSCRGADGALSRFPQGIGRKLLLLYTNEGDTVFDPFAGHNSRMELCYRARRNYVGCDLSREFMEANNQIKSMLQTQREADLFPAHFTATIELIETDSRWTGLEDGFADFTITSPPYYDLEKYGDEDAQLGNAPTYAKFLSSLRAVMAENLRVLRPGAFCVWCVNDFRRKGTFHNYHGDVIRLMNYVGFVQHDIAITDLGSPIRAAFATQVVEQKILPKRHEYNLIFVKPCE